MAYYGLSALFPWLLLLATIIGVALSGNRRCARNYLGLPSYRVRQDRRSPDRAVIRIGGRPAAQ
jgi:hypothetical protein